MTRHGAGRGRAGASSAGAALLVALLAAGCTSGSENEPPGTTAAVTASSTAPNPETSTTPDAGAAESEDPATADTPAETTATTPSGTDSAPAAAPSSAAGTDEQMTDGLPALTSAEPQTAQGSGPGDLVLQQIRVAEHRDFDRVVLEFSGSGVPSWTVAYVASAAGQGSGEAIAVEGDAVLDVTVGLTTSPAAGGPFYDGPSRFEPADSDQVEEVVLDGVFEGATHLVLGIDEAQQPFRVFALSDPVRLVIDVADD